MGNLWAFALKKQCRRHHKTVVVIHSKLELLLSDECF